MNLLLHPGFWLAVVAAQFVLAIGSGRRTATIFGMFNLAVLAILVGWQAALTVLVLAVLLWSVLQLVPSEAPAHHADRASRTAAGMCAVLVVVLVVYKVAREHPGLLAFDPAVSILAAISFSYVFLRSIDLTIAVTGRVAPLLDPIALAGYLAPFHMLLAGPINPYREHAVFARQPPAALAFPAFVAHLNTIATGLVYKFVIAESLRILAFGAGGALAAPASLADTAFLLVYLFFDFAGYSKVALGIGRLIGVPTPENFRAPLLAVSVTDFWNRWHMSLGAFVFRNIYTPLQLYLVRRVGVGRARHVSLLTLITAFGFVGVWHRMSAGFALWGVAMAIIMFVELVIRDYASRVPALQHHRVGLALRIVGPIYVIATISVSLRFIMREFLGL